MGRLFNGTDRSSLKPGDHIYTWRAAYIYAHHGIYIGDDKVINFTIHGKAVGTGTCKDIFLASSNPAESPVVCTSCKPASSYDHGVVLSCLDCFLGRGKLYRFEYGVSRAVFLAKVRGGTCTLAVSDPVEIVVHRANYLLTNGFGCYNLFKNNCENFAIYCKTGLVRFRTSGKMKAGQSGQIASTIRGTPIAAMTAGTTLLSVAEISMIAEGGMAIAGMSAVTGEALVAGAAMFCVARLNADIGVRKDVMKVSVEDLAAYRPARGGSEDDETNWNDHVDDGWNYCHMDTGISHQHVWLDHCCHEINTDIYGDDDN